MRLPDWEEATVELYRSRWESIKSASAPSVYSAAASLLSTQEGNPVPESLLRHLSGSRNRERHYYTLGVPKRRGGVRELSVPSDTMKWVQRGLLQVLTHLFPRHRCAVGFERGESPVSHARRHVGRRFVYVVDIADFFPSITWDRVYGMLQVYPFELPSHAARLLANLATYDGALPQGAPSSPILANLLCRKLDSRLFKWARTNGYHYSRYADDLAFSTDKGSFPSRDQEFIDAIIREERFTVNAAKRRLMPYSRRQMVTGLVVNEKPNLPRPYVRGIRALLHNVERHGWESQVDRDLVFESADEWVTYRNRDLSLEETKAVQHRQSQAHLLVRPSSRLPKAKDVPSLQSVLRGRIAYLGLVRGEECPLYRRLLDRYRLLIEREKGLARGREIYSQLRVKAEEKTVPVVSSEKGIFVSPLPKNPYAVYMEIDELPEKEYRAKLKEFGATTLEYRFLLRKNRSGDGLRAAARQIANSELTSPEETAHFFAEFDDDRTFRGLLHEPIAQELSPTELVGACEEALSRYKLPNRLRDHTDQLLQECRTWLPAHEGQYPWQDDDLRTRVLIPYKRETRFDFGDGLTLVDQLDPFIKGLKRRHGKEIDIDADFVLQTYVPDVLNAIRTLLTAMIQHTSADGIRIEVPEVLGGGPIAIHILDEGSVMHCPAELATGVLKGESSRAVSLLRGYAYWRITAPFSDGHSYVFNVMTNERTEAPEPAQGVLHTLTFPVLK